MRHEPTCLSDTRVDVLQEIHAWANEHDKSFMFWLSGLAGTGKSTIARTVARMCSEQGSLGASFFFARGGGDVGHARFFFTSIAVQLANKSPTLQQFICDAIRENSDITALSLGDQWRQLILRPLSKLARDSGPTSYILVVDALDECDNESDIRIIIRLLAEARSLETVQLRVFFTSRPEIPMRHSFSQIPEAEHRDFILHDIEADIIDYDISMFIDYELRSIGEERALEAGWPGEQALTKLVLNASGLFIWAATACRFIREGRAATRLSMMIDGSTSNLGAVQHLNKIYMTVLRNSVHDGYLEEEKQDLYLLLRQVLGAIVAMSSPLSVRSLYRLLDLPKGAIEEVLASLHAILDIPKDPGQPLRLHHPSFRDFLADKMRCNDLNFWVDETQAHRALAESCMRLMTASLKQDICEVGTPSVLLTDIAVGRVEQCIPPEVQYACLYWIQHLRKSGSQLYDNDETHQFLQAHLLHWLEALSWMRKVSEGIRAIAALESMTVVSQLLGFHARLANLSPR